MACKSVFVTATGTDIGKTYVSALLVKKMREFGLNCGYYKPALSGAVRDGGKLIPGDCAYVLKTAGLDIEPMNCVSYVFEEAVSPHLAAARAGVSIELDKIKSDYENLSAKYDYLVVEGAGGIVCPFNLEKGILIPDVIKTLNLPILVVADGGLGTINSVVLTVEYAKLNGLNIKGIILNNFDENDFMHIDNKLQVERLTGVNVLATVGKAEMDLKIEDKVLSGLFTREEEVV
ncbi:MAG: dethiobiotin synthase [Muribaculaceae bacterium]|nr:dethiobiotin synthase [Muribaculaceae bacterium]